MSESMTPTQIEILMRDIYRVQGYVNNGVAKTSNGGNKMSFIPRTPAGSMLVDLEADTKEEAIQNLLDAASHMPYKTWENFEKRGYEIVETDYDDMGYHPMEVDQ